MKIKIFTPNENGKIELTKEELESLLNESYRQGWNDKPYYRDYYYSTYSNTLTGTAADTAYAYNISDNSSSITNACAEALEKDMEAFKVALKETEVNIL